MITAPWPPSELNPNRRQHWAKHAKVKKAYKDLCAWSLVGKKPVIMDGTIYLKITFHPPDKRKRDQDNTIASIKYLLDTVAKLWGVDDHRFHCQYHWGDIVPNGKVTIEYLVI